jgi:hypothetical protein
VPSLEIDHPVLARDHHLAVRIIQDRQDIGHVVVPSGQEEPDPRSLQALLCEGDPRSQPLPGQTHEQTLDRGLVLAQGPVLVRIQNGPVEAGRLHVPGEFAHRFDPLERVLMAVELGAVDAVGPRDDGDGALAGEVASEHQVLGIVETGRVHELAEGSFGPVRVGGEEDPVRPGLCGTPQEVQRFRGVTACSPRRS